MLRRVQCQPSGSRPYVPAFIRFNRPVKIIDPPAALKLDQRKSCAVFSFVFAAKMNIKQDMGTESRGLAGAQYFGVEHSPVRDDQLVPFIVGNLLSVLRGKHSVRRVQLPAIERLKLRPNDVTRSAGENSEGRLDANENPRGQREGGQGE